MRYLILLFFTIGFASCWTEQWEDRVAAGDTGSVTHGEKKHERAPLYCGNASIHPKNGLGKPLFKAKCAACHNASDLVSTGPGLMGVLGRIPAGDWKYHFVRNADSLIKSGDTYANAKFEEYNKSAHPPFPDLTNEEIDAILDCFN
jgi:cytochrome c2